MIKYQNITAIEYEEPETMNDYGYKFTIGGLGSGICTAYRTEEGFKNFLKIYNIKIDYIEVKNWKMTDKKIKIYHFKPFNLEEHLFWNIEEVKGFNTYIGLENGSYVVCYYKHTRKGTIIMKPNPNAKNVYTELDYFEMSKIWG